MEHVRQIKTPAWRGVKNADDQNLIQMAHGNLRRNLLVDVSEWISTPPNSHQIGAEFCLNKIGGLLSHSGTPKSSKSLIRPFVY